MQYWTNVSDGPTRQANEIKRFVNEMYPLDRVKAVFVHELYNDRNPATGGTAENQVRHWNLGIVNKPAFTAYRDAIAARWPSQCVTSPYACQPMF